MFGRQPDDAPLQQPTVGVVSVDQLPPHLLAQLNGQGQAVQGASFSVASSGWESTGGGYGQQTYADIDAGFQVQTTESPFSGFPEQRIAPASESSRTVLERIRQHKVGAAIVGLAFLGIAVYGVDQFKGSDPQTQSTLVHPQQKKPAAAKAAKANAVTDVAPSDVPNFTPTDLGCADVASIGVNSTVPVDWSPTLYGQAGKRVWVRSNNTLNSNPATIAGSSLVKWQVCLNAETPAADNPATKVQNLTVERTDPSSSQTIKANLGSAVLVPTIQIDPANSYVTPLPDDYLTAVFMKVDSVAAGQDLTQFKIVYESNKNQVQVDQANYLVAQSYTQNVERLNKDARAALQKVIEEKAQYQGIPADKRRVDVSTGQPADPTPPYAQAVNPVEAGAAFHIRFDDAQKLEVFNYTSLVQ